MDFRAKGNGYSESIQAYPEANEFQYLNRSPQASIRAPRKQGVFSASTAYDSGYSGADTWEEPLNPNQPQFMPPPPRRSCFGILSSWIWELLSCFLALGALAGILVILKQFDGRALRDWPYSITINTLLSVLVTIIKAAIVVPLAEGISQLKWTWYKKRDHALRDLVLYDDASRGVFGASKFVLSKNPLHLATAASFLFIASFAIGPFAQQVVHFDQRNVLSTEMASLPVCTKRYEDWSGVKGPGFYVVGLPTLGAIQDGFYQNSSNTPIESTCQSGNCTFAPYQSLGFCSRCADISDEIVPHHPTTGKVIAYEDCPGTTGCNFDLRDGNLKVGPSGSSRTVVNTTATFEMLHPDMSKIPGFANVTTLKLGKVLENSKTPGISAYECSLYFCVLHYHGEVTAGKFVETPTEIPSNLAIEDAKQGLWSLSNITITPDQCLKDGVVVSPPYSAQDNCSYGIYGINGRALQQAILPLFEGYGIFSTRPAWYPDSIRRYGESSSNETNPIEAVFKSLAQRLTTHVRNAPNICRSTIYGKTFVGEAFISVTWMWIIYPAVVVAATFILLVAIIVRTRDEYIWKSSPLALVFLGMQDQRQSDGVTHPIFPVNPEMKSMDNSSWGIKMRLDRSGRWNIVGNQ